MSETSVSFSDTAGRNIPEESSSYPGLLILCILSSVLKPSRPLLVNFVGTACPNCQ
jgi:hypothetical protein